MTLYLIGIGLWDENDLSCKARAILARCCKIYAETYTSRLMGANWPALEKRVGTTITLVDRETVEQRPGPILAAAGTSDVAFLVVGDAMAATTHVDLRLRAHRHGVETQLVHGASVLTAVPGELGLQHYKFGRTTTLGYPEGDYLATSPYDMICENLERGLHTLVLLDIRAAEGRFMTADEALAVLARFESRAERGVFTSERLVCVVARAGSPAPLVAADRFDALAAYEFGTPLHSLVVPGRLHFMEEDALKAFAGATQAVLEHHREHYRPPSGVGAERE